MRWPARFRDDESGFTLVELIVGMAIVGLLMGAIGSALIVGLRTKDTTFDRFKESHDQLISSAYLANDVQSAATVSNIVPAGSHCDAPKTKLIDFNYASGKTASYFCMPATEDGKLATNVTRSFSGDSVVVAHFAAAAVPIVTCPPDPSCSSKPDVVSIRFTELSGYGFTLLGSRRAYLYNWGTGSPPPTSPPITLLATGSNPQLYVQGGCKSGGANANCIPENGTVTNSLPIADVLPITGWTTTPLWSKLNDASDSTFVVNNLGAQDEATVAMSAVPTPTGTPTVSISARAMVAHFVPGSGGGGPEKLTLTLYQVKPNGTTTTVAANTFQISETDITDYSYPLKANEVNKISNYGNLRIGFAMTQGVSGENINVYGISLDTTPIQDSSSVGNPVLTVNGYLLVNSTLSNAVRLTGTKNATKLSIVHTGTDSPFGIFSSGSCSGCLPQTVDCATCHWFRNPPWTGNQPWTSYSPRIVDPLRFMSAPTDAGVTTTSSCPNGYGRINPGVYANQLAITSDTCLNGGIYILKAGMQVNANANVVGQQVLLFNQAGPIKFNGGSTIQLTAYNSAPYQGILIFQARCTGSDPLSGCGANYNDSPITLNGGTNVNGQPVSQQLSGIIYAPASSMVTLGSGGANLHVTAVIAQNLTVTGSSSVTIG
jgi:prepilin-type N-terminal cleavage/methylation domain-containing protein